MLDINEELQGLILPSGRRATTNPDPTRPENRNPAYGNQFGLIRGQALRTVMTASPFALESTEGGMTLSGPNDCRGSTKLIVSKCNYYSDIRS
jgi:hypothetical protein